MTPDPGWCCISDTAALDLKLLHTLPTTRIWHRLTSGYLQLSTDISKDFNAHVMKMIKLIGESGFEKGLKDSTAASSRNLLSAVGIALN